MPTADPSSARTDASQRGGDGVPKGPATTAAAPSLRPAARLAFAVALLGLLLGGLWFYESERRRLQTEAEANLEAIAKLKVAQIVSWRAERLGDGLAIMEHAFLAEGLARLPTEKERGAARQSLLSQFRALQRAYGYDDILFADAAGGVRLSLSGAVGPLHDEAARAVGEAIRTRRPVLTDIHVGPAGRPAHMDVVAPVWAGEREEAVGAVVLRSDAQTFLYPLIQTWPVPSASAETLLVRREGETAFFLSPLRYRSDAALTLHMPLSREDVPSAMAVRGKEGFVRGTDYRGVPVFAYLMRVQGSPWFIVAKVDAAEALLPWRPRSILIAGLVLGLGAWIATLSLALSQRGRAIHYASLIAARERAEEALRATSSRQEAILAAVPDIIMEVDNNKTYTWANRAGVEFFGEDVIGREAAHYFVGEQETYSVVRPLFMGSEDVLYVESWQRRRDGESRLLAWWCRVLKDDNGSVTGALSSARDVTEQRRAEDEVRRLNEELEQRVRERTAELEAANKELESFAYSVSHDLRAPLRGIDGWSLALLEDCGDQLGDEARQHLERVRSEAQHMGRLIDDLLQLSRVARLPMQRVPVDLSALAEEIVARLRAGPRQGQVDVAIQTGLAAQGDGTLLEIALTNLLDNAWKFTSTRARATIELGQVAVDGHAAFFVRDNGVGFDMAFSHKLFGAFQRLHKVSEFPGTGIGLASVQRIVHRHGGRVWAEAEIDRGATFYFTLEGDS